jgi:hypothetical protein
MTSLKSIQIKRAENLHASASRSWLISYVNGEKPLDGHLRKAIADYTEAAKIWTDVAYPSFAKDCVNACAACKNALNEISKGNR